MRRNLGIAPGGALILDECNGELRLKPAAVLEFEHYSNSQIKDWDRADFLSTDERKQILERQQR